MFFSVIIPIYRVEEYLNECVDSVLAQSFTDFEIILVDDGSLDKCPIICDDYEKKDKRVTVIHKKNGGLSDARNVGLSIAKGKYIIFIDSDDFISKDYFLEMVYEKCKRNTDIILYKFVNYYEDSKTRSKCRFHFPADPPSENKAEIINALVKNNAFYCSAWSKCIKASLLTENGIQFEVGLLGEDQEWYYHVLMYSQSISWIDEDFIVYRQRTGSISHSISVKNILDSIYTLEKWSHRILESNFNQETKNAFLGSFGRLYANLLIGSSRLEGKLSEDTMKKMKKLSYLLKYRQNKRTFILGGIYHIVGFNNTMQLLRIVCTVKKSS